MRLTGGTYLGAMPRRPKTTWIKHRPTLPFPSTNGWIVSNCACAIAAWTTADRSSRFRNSARSPSSALTSSGGGGMKSALRGLVAPPPIQFCFVRTTPAMWVSRVADISMWCSSTTSFAASRFVREPSFTAASIARMFPRTDSAVTSMALVEAYAAFARRRCDNSRPSMRELAIDSARRRLRASASKDPNVGG